MYSKWFYLVGGFFEPFHRFLAILLNSMPMEMFQTHFIRDLRNEISRKNLVTSNKDVDGSRDLMLSSIISKMCIAFNELYSHSEPKISREWHWRGHSDDGGNVMIWDFLHQHLCNPWTINIFLNGFESLVTLIELTLNGMTWVPYRKLWLL